MIKISIVILSLLGVSGGVFAQNSSILKELEAPDSITRAKVIVSNSVMVDLVGRDTVMPGYRIRIYFNNSQETREEVRVVETKYKELYPTDRVYIEYKAPYFKITVGDFINYEEALVKWSSIVVDFKNAFIVQEHIPISALKNPKNIKPEEPVIDSLSTINQNDIIKYF